MNQFAKRILESTGLCTVLALTVLILLSPGIAGAQVIQLLADGALPNAAGGWNLPAQGTCPVDLSQATRPDCVALRLDVVQASCVSPTMSWSTGVCNDLINNTAPLCVGAPDRKWNLATGICSIVMMDDDRNNVVCALHQGTWVTAGTCTGAWLMPTGGSYNPPVLTAAAGSAAGAGDQCLRCHNQRTQYNGPRVRDTEDTIYMGHKNMSRKVTVSMPWGGPPFACTGYPAATSEEECFENLGVWDPTIYPGTDTGQNFNWALGTVDIGPLGSPNPRSLYWIYADWLSAYPRAVYHDVANTATTPDSPKVSYSCARCHTTGWSADATLKTNKEPHKSFLAEAPVGSNPVTGTPSIVWDGLSDAVAGQVNLAPGAPFNTKTASWDVWGISCTRCHGSAIDNTTNGGVPPMTAPAGRSTHHSDMTGPEAGGGYCTNPDWNSLATCTPAGGDWLTACSDAGVCSNPLFTTSSTCSTGGGTWTAYTTQALCLGALKTWNGTGCIGDATKTTQAACETAARVWYGGRCSVNTFTTQTNCETAGAVWSNDQCSLGGVCNNPLYGDAVSCRANGAQWAAATDIIRCEDAGGHWTGTRTNRGMVITSLCMNCHRQEASGAPIDATNPATAIKVGPYHGSVGFVSHPHANQFLNSPHAKFTGTFAQVPTGKLWSEYNSYFMTEAEAGKTGNGCTGCHDVHSSVVAGEKPFAEECTECHAKDLSNMIHSGGVGTPLEEMATDPMEACVICHMPAGEHLFRINVDEDYSTKPAGAMIANTNATTAPDGSYANAVWVDLDSACGKCHGGGVANVESTGSVYLKFWDEAPLESNTSCAEAGGTWTAGKCTVPAADATACANAFGTWTASTSLCTLSAAKYLRVPDATAAGLTVGQRIEVVGAGALYYDEVGTSKLNEDFETYIASKDRAPWITLAGTASKTVINAPVAQNPIKNNAAYFTKAELAVKAAGIHNDKPYVNFGYNLTPGNTLELNVDASASNCSDSLANCDAFVWAWDDGTTTTTSTPTATHLYGTAGTKSVTLTVEEYGVSEGSVTKLVKVFTVDAPPVAGGTDCASIINLNTWAASLTDNSTDANGVRQVTVKWGDGGAISSAIDNTAPYSLIGTVFTHTYLNPASVSIKQTAYDTLGQANVRTCPPVTLSTFSISGNARRLNNVPVAGATVRIKVGTTTIRTVTTNSLGNYTVANLKPGTYNVTATKTGLTFPQVYNQLVGPSAPGLNFQSTQ